MRWAFQLSSFQKLVTKPLAVATHLDDPDFLAQLEAVDRFTANMIAYPGRTFGQLYHRFVKGNALVSGAMELGGRDDLGGEHQGAGAGLRRRDRRDRADAGRASAVVPLLTGPRRSASRSCPGGHLGMLTGRAARRHDLAGLDEWIDQWSSPAAEEPTPRPATASPAPRW